MKTLSMIFKCLSLILSHVMCAVVAYHYCDLTWSIRYAGYSAPAGTALFYAVPYLVGIAACALLAGVLQKKSTGK